MTIVAGGFVDYWRTQVFPTLQCDKGFQKKPVALKDAIGIFFPLAVGIGLAGLVLIGEFIHAFLFSWRGKSEDENLGNG